MPAIIRSVEERERLLSAYKASGLGAKAFAESEQLPVSTLYQWLGNEARGKPVRIARVIRRAAARACRPVKEEAEARRPTKLMVELGSARVHVGDNFDRATLTVLLEVLATRRHRAS